MKKTSASFWFEEIGSMFPRLPVVTISVVGASVVTIAVVVLVWVVVVGAVVVVASVVGVKVKVRTKCSTFHGRT